MGELEDEASRPSTSRLSTTKRKRKSDNVEDHSGTRAHKVAYIHVGEGGERDLEDHLRGTSRVDIQVLSYETLPDIDASDMIHGLDSSGTSRDYVDETHRCNVACPVGYQGHLRPNEIIIYESIRYEGRLLGRKRIKGRFVSESASEDVVSLDMTDFRRVGSRSVRQRGTHAVMGVATGDATLHAAGYQSLVGNDDQSWGWDIGRLKVFHQNTAQQPGNYYPGSVTHHHQWTVPDTFTMVLDMDQGCLGYFVGDQWLGWAVTGLKAHAPLYPIASTVWGHCEVKLKYLQGFESGVLGLQDIVRSVIRDSLNPKSIHKDSFE